MLNQAAQKKLLVAFRSTQACPGSLSRCQTVHMDPKRIPNGPQTDFKLSHNRLRMDMGFPIDLRFASTIRHTSITIHHVSSILHLASSIIHHPSSIMHHRPSLPACRSSNTHDAPARPLLHFAELKGFALCRQPPRWLDALVVGCLGTWGCGVMDAG